MKLQHCTLCPKACGADRTRTAGWCGGGAEMRAARAALHFWEEPCISGKGGAGAVFFSGCALRCCFCQNRQISQEWFGKAISVSQLSEILLRLQEQGAETLDLVTGSHYAPWIAESLQQVKPQLHIPVVWNSSGYDSSEILSLLDGLVDVYLPDWKYVDNRRAVQRHSGLLHRNRAGNFGDGTAGGNARFEPWHFAAWRFDTASDSSRTAACLHGIAAKDCCNFSGWASLGKPDGAIYTTGNAAP